MCSSELNTFPNHIALSNLGCQFRSDHALLLAQDCLAIISYASSAPSDAKSSECCHDVRVTRNPWNRRVFLSELHLWCSTTCTNVLVKPATFRFAFSAWYFDLESYFGPYDDTWSHQYTCTAVPRASLSAFSITSTGHRAAPFSANMANSTAPVSRSNKIKNVARSSHASERAAHGYKWKFHGRVRASHVFLTQNLTQKLTRQMRESVLCTLMH